MKTSEQNASSLALYIGKTGVLRCEYLSVDVTIVDDKRSYGRTLLLVRPVSGSDEQWLRKAALPASRITHESRLHFRRFGNGGAARSKDRRAVGFELDSKLWTKRLGSHHQWYGTRECQK